MGHQQSKDVFMKDNIFHFKVISYCKYYKLFRLSDMQSNLIGHPNHYIEQAGPLGSAWKLVILQSCNIHNTKIKLTDPSHKEHFYLAALLNHRPMWDWADATIVNSVELGSYQQAASKLGLFATESEAEAAIQEGIEKLLTPPQLRHLFVWLLLDGQVMSPIKLWSQFHHQFTQDHFLWSALNHEVAFNKALWDMSLLLKEHGKSLEDYRLPQPIEQSSEVFHELQNWAPDLPLLVSHAQLKKDQMNDKQLNFYMDLLHAIDNKIPFTPFITGGMGHRKSFTVETALNFIWSRGQIAIMTATSIFAAQIILGGKTTHLVFKVLIPHYPYTLFAYLM